jgi:hypothetical protein
MKPWAALLSFFGGPAMYHAGFLKPKEHVTSPLVGPHRPNVFTETKIPGMIWL